MTIRSGKGSPDATPYVKREGRCDDEDASARRLPSWKAARKAIVAEPFARNSRRGMLVEAAGAADSALSVATTDGAAAEGRKWRR
jgi:hypothetical protein